MKNSGIFFLFLIILLFAACDNTPKPDPDQKKIDYIREIPGESDSIPAANVQKGKVLIAYSDCYICHKEDERSIGPAFKDIARRYPVQDRYIDMLAYKIISGGYGAWGNAAMSDHANLSHEDARIMVSYILSLRE